MSETHTGACMCGALQFSFSGKPKFVADCVCESCRRAHGATAVAWVGSLSVDFNVDQGESVLTWYASSGDSQRGFCSACGTRLFFRSSRWPNETHMAGACINHPHELQSTGISFRDELPTWTAMTLSDTKSE